MSDQEWTKVYEVFKRNRIWINELVDFVAEAKTLGALNQRQHQIAEVAGRNGITAKDLTYFVSELFKKPIALHAMRAEMEQKKVRENISQTERKE
jgi:hypothetical protein